MKKEDTRAESGREKREKEERVRDISERKKVEEREQRSDSCTSILGSCDFVFAMGAVAGVAADAIGVVVEPSEAETGGP